MPLFERYTARLFNAYAKELLPHHTDLDEYWCALYEATNQIVIKIAPTNGFMADLSDDWRDLVPLLVTSAEARQTLNETAPDGDWEMYLVHTFDRYLRTQPRKQREALWTYFQLKYQFHLRLFTNHWEFDRRLRLYISNLHAYWMGQVTIRAASKPVEHTKEEHRPRPPVDRYNRIANIVNQTVPTGHWKKHLVEIAGAIDLWNREHGEEESIPTSKPWKKKGISRRQPCYQLAL